MRFQIVGKRTARATVIRLSASAIAVVTFCFTGQTPWATPARVFSDAKPSPAFGAGTEAAALPRTYLGLDDDQGPARLVVVRTATGQVTRQLVPSIPGGGVSFPSSTARRPFVVYEQGLGTCAAEIYQVDLRTLHRQSEVAQPAGGGVADSNPSLSPDGRFVAFMRTRCTGSHGSISTLDIARAGGQVVSVSRAGYYPASGQAWGPNSRAILALTLPPAHAPTRPLALHVVTVNAEGSIVRNRTLPPPAGCHFDSALFSPGGSAIADMSCGEQASLVKLDPRTGHVMVTLVTSERGRALFLGPIDQSGNALMYGTAPLTSAAPLEATRWYVLSGGRSWALTVPRHIMPSAW